MPSSLKSSNFITSAIIKPFSKSVWIFPAACGALVPFYNIRQERKSSNHITQKIICISFYTLWSVKLKLVIATAPGSHLNGPCFYFIRSRSKEILKLERFISLHYDFVQSSVKRKMFILCNCHWHWHKLIWFKILRSNTQHFWCQMNEPLSFVLTSRITLPIIHVHRQIDK